jgi:hypothetical protein
VTNSTALPGLFTSAGRQGAAKGLKTAAVAVQPHAGFESGRRTSAPRCAVDLTLANAWKL